MAVENFVRRSADYVAKRAAHWPALVNDGEDVFQSIATTAWAESGGDEVVFGNFVVGHSRQVRNYSRPAHRRRREAPHLGLVDDRSEVPSQDPGDCVESAFAYRELVSECRTLLSPTEFAVLRLVGEFGIPEEEAAKRLGVCERTVRYALQRARTKMQAKLRAAA